MKAIGFPFKLDDYGRIHTTTDQRKIYLDRVLTLLSTVASQRPMRPDYGTHLEMGIYESGGDQQQGIKATIANAIMTWLPNVTLTSVNVSTPGPDGISTVSVSVTLPDNSEGTVTVNSGLLYPDGTLYQ